MTLPKHVFPASRGQRSKVFYRLGYCLSSLGMLSATIAQAQTVAMTPVGTVLSNLDAETQQPDQGSTAAQLKAAQLKAAQLKAAQLKAAQLGQPLSVSSPELLQPESSATQTGQPATTPNPLAKLEVAAATIAAPDSLPVDPPVQVEVAATQDPAAIEVAPAAAPEVTRPAEQPAYEAPSQIIFSERSSGCQASVKVGQAIGNEFCDQPATPTTTAKSPQDSKSAATAAAQAASKSGKVATKKAPIPQANLPISAAPVRLGPVSLSSAGIGVSSTVQPYFNPKLYLTKLPGLQDLKLLFPLAIPAPITSLFGWRIHPISGTQRLHTGTDLGAPMGTPVLAALAGRVILADIMGGYGITVALEHENGIRQTLYAHLSELFVRPGDAVQQGTVIGRVGSTGASTGPHLHFELRQMLPDGTWVAQDASQKLEFALAQLVQSLQIAQQPQQVAQTQGAQPQGPIGPMPAPAAVQ